MTYVDAGVLAVPTANRDSYREMSAQMGAAFKAHGALSYVECWGDEVPEGKVTSFPRAVKRRPDETVVLSWIVWPSREVRDAGMQAATAVAPAHDEEQRPFDGSRAFWGGFEVLVEL